MQAKEAAAIDKTKQAELADALSSLQFQLDEAGVHAAEGQRLLEEVAAREARLQKEVQDGAAYTQEIEGKSPNLCHVLFRVMMVSAHYAAQR